MNHRQKQASEVGHDDVIKFELNIAMYSPTAKADLLFNNLLKPCSITRIAAVDMVLWQSVPLIRQYKVHGAQQKLIRAGTLIILGPKTTWL